MREALLGRNPTMTRDPREVRPASIQLVLSVAVLIMSFMLLSWMGSFPLLNQWTVLLLFVGSGPMTMWAAYRLVMFIP